ncbi:CsbD family protein [Aureimonas populi]|uniref:CsbD family protein n=1 Tax=Aureimonas populi TaxID=1701758 RepID=A0ABW5CPM7_9HYPH|nr:CsbD family protein [Aureimonas populi]
MDADRKTKGSLKEAIGKITGDKAVEAEGAAQKAGIPAGAGKAGRPAGDVSKR